MPVRRVSPSRQPWNKGLLVGQKKPLEPKHVWSIRVRLEIAGSKRDLAIFNLAIDSKLRACDLVKLRLDDICSGLRVRQRVHASGREVCRVRLAAVEFRSGVDEFRLRRNGVKQRHRRAEFEVVGSDYSARRSGVQRRISQARPCGRQSSRTSPFSDTIILPMTCIPKPRRVGSAMAGPAVSDQ